MAPGARQRPDRGQGAAENITDVHGHRTRRIDVELDRQAELVACSACWLDRLALMTLHRRCGGPAAIVEALAGVKTAWAELYTAVLRVMDAYSDAVVAADHFDLLVALSGVADLEHLNAFVDPEPITEVLARKVSLLTVVTGRRDLAGAALAVAVDLDRGELPDEPTWVGLRDGADALLGLEGTWTR